MWGARIIAIIVGAGCASAGAPDSGDDTGGSNTPMVDARVEVPIDACPDMDNDGACNAADLCPGSDDRLDSDSDTIADGCDECPGMDDRIDVNMNGMPDGCETQTRTVDLKQVGTNFWRGWYASNSAHATTNDYTLTGDFNSGVYNSYFVFPLAGITATSVVSVSLVLTYEANATGDPTETFSIWDVTTAATTVENSTTNAAIHSDLMTGTSYGTQVLTSAQLTTTVTIPLSAQAALDVKAKLGADFVVGVHLDTPPGWIRFGSTGAATTRLVINYLP
jgi:hypothetical protein